MVSLTSSIGHDGAARLAHFFSIPIKVLSLEESLSSTDELPADTEGVEALDVCCEAGAEVAGDGPGNDDDCILLQLWGRVEEQTQISGACLFELSLQILYAIARPGQEQTICTVLNS